MGACLSFAGEAHLRDSGWPRHYTNGNASLVVYHPQIDTWNAFQSLKGRCAFALTPGKGSEPVYGTFRFEGETLVDADNKLVLLRNLRSSDMRFPGATPAESATWPALAQQLLPSSALVISLDRILAYMRANETPRREARILTEAPPIFVRNEPALLVITDGAPVMVDVENTSVSRVINTNWDLYRHRRTNHYYLRHGAMWFGAPDLKGTFAPVTELPGDLARLPADSSRERKSGSSREPHNVIVVDRPAELIVLQGSPELAQVGDSQLLYVTNTESDLFFHPGASQYYFLTAGRWFAATSLQGPWTYASFDLPSDFRRIPMEHPKSRVLASVPGTREAEDAVLLAAIPRTAEIQRDQVKADVSYVGKPEFVSIPGTPVTYATNTPNDVLRVGDVYYLCLQGVWFTSRAPTGPWQAADRIPEEIYSIPESSPKYNVTYVRVYDSTPSTIVVGYTPGYYGAYVSGGVVVWGTGYYYPPYVAVGVAVTPVYWSSPYHTYGAAAWYNPTTGVYARGSAVYGPNGGYGGGVAYNPRTGTYAQGAGVYGPNGGAAAARTYNPRTGTSSAGYNAANPYRSWGEGVVSNGSNWARGGYESTSRGTVAAGETSKGGAGVAFDGAGGKAGYVAKSGSGDVYAGANGNVYKRDNGQWYQNQNGSWNAVDKGSLDAPRDHAAARDWGSRNAQISERVRSGGGSLRGQGGGQRPQFQGRRR